MTDGDAGQNQGGGWLSGAWSLGQSVYNAAASAVNRWDAGKGAEQRRVLQFKLELKSKASVGPCPCSIGPQFMCDRMRFNVTAQPVPHARDLPTPAAPALLFLLCAA